MTQARDFTKRDARIANNRPATPRSGWGRVWDVLRGPYPTLVSRALVGGVFILAGVSKALAISAFAGEITAYQIVPAGIAQVMALVFPLIEILIGVFLILGLATRWAAAAAGGMLLIFIIAIISAMARGLNIDCGCFGNALGLGALRETVSWRKVFEDLLWLALSVHLFFVPTIFSIDGLQKKDGK